MIFFRLAPKFDLTNIIMFTEISTLSQSKKSHTINSTFEPARSIMKSLTFTNGAGNLARGDISKKRLQYSSFFDIKQWICYDDLHQQFNIG